MAISSTFRIPRPVPKPSPWHSLLLNDSSLYRYRAYDVTIESLMDKVIALHGVICGTYLLQNIFLLNLN